MIPAAIFKKLLAIALTGLSLVAYSQSKGRRSEADCVLKKIKALPEIREFMGNTSKEYMPI